MDVYKIKMFIINLNLLTIFGYFQEKLFTHQSQKKDTVTTNTLPQPQNTLQHQNTPQHKDLNNPRSMRRRLENIPNT